jgi:sulfiredoxin
MKREKFAIANIYVPAKRRATLNPETVQAIAQSMLEVAQRTRILLRRDGERFVLVHGLHRLEACKALGEDSIFGYLVQAKSIRLRLKQPERLRSAGLSSWNVWRVHWSYSSAERTSQPRRRRPA